MNEPNDAGELEVVAYGRTYRVNGEGQWASGIVHTVNYVRCAGGCG